MREFGDNEKISTASGINRVTISNAFTEGECSSDTFLAINNFYTDKKARIDESKSKVA